MKKEGVGIGERGRGLSKEVEHASQRTIRCPIPFAICPQTEFLAQRDSKGSVSTGRYEDCGSGK